MKILLVNAPPIKRLGITGQIYPPLGILYLASYARAKRPDFEFAAIDGYQEDPRELTRQILAYGPRVLGVSFGTQSATGAYQLINEVKERAPDMIVVAGGPHATFIPDEVYQRSKADLVVVGEGEQTFFELLERIDAGEAHPESVAGTVVRRDGAFFRNPARPFIKNLDEIPFPARDLLDIRRYPGYMYKRYDLDTSMISARGCPFNCVYCSNPVWKSQKPWYRVRTPKNVADEMEHVVETYGIREFFDETDEFNGHKRWAKAVCEEIAGRGLDIAWKAQMRVDGMDEELADKLKQSGFWMGLFGLESGNNATLAGINKRQTVEEADRALTLMKARGIKCFGLFMAFNVWEEDGQLRFEDKRASLQTLEFARTLIRQKKLHLIGWSMTTPFPGSRLYDIALKHELIKPSYVGHWEEFDSGANFTMRLPGVTERDWLDVQAAGKRLQAKLLFTSGSFNLKAFPLYVKKAYLIAKRSLQVLLGKNE